jgi:hypothetical protein
MRWMSIPITRCISCSFQLRWTGAVGDTTTTDPRSRRNRVGHRGGQLTTRALGSLYRNGLPTDVLPVPLVPGWSHHTPGPSCPSRMSEHPRSSYRLPTLSSGCMESSSDGSRCRPYCHRLTRQRCCCGLCSPPARLACARSIAGKRSPPNLLLSRLTSPHDEITSRRWRSRRANPYHIPDGTLTKPK